MRLEQAPMTMLLLVLAVCLPGASDADILTVCSDGMGDYTVIQAAIDAASGGDVVELCDAEFIEYGISFRGKAITVRSSSGNPELCMIRSQVIFESGEGPSSVLAGVTVSVSGALGALWCGGVSPTIEDVRVVDCANLVPGGITLFGSNAVFRRCVISGNAATDQQQGDAGGVLMDSSSPTFEDCALVGNHALDISGGVKCTSGSSPTFVRCTIVGNRSGTAGGGLFLGTGTHASLDHCILRGNCAGTVGDEAFVAGGGTLTLICCDVDSTGFAGAGTIEYVGENLFVDPLFCAPASCDAAPTTAGDYRLAQNSPCLLGPCGQIGAFGQGCGIIGIDAWSWGRIKALHR